MRRYLVIILLLAFAILIVNLDAKWFGHHEPNGVWISTSVRNWNWYSPLELQFLPATTAEPVASMDDLYRYVHHPPLIVWITGGASFLFGGYANQTPYEMLVRSVSVFSTLISLSAFFVMSRRLLGERGALLALALYTFTPMTLYFGRMPNHEPLELALLYSFIAVFINWMRQYTHQRTVIMMILGVLAMWTAWAGAFFFLPLGIVALIYGKAPQRRGIVVIGVVTILAAIGVLAFFEATHAGSIEELQNAFLYRASSASLAPDSETFTFGGFIVQWFVHSLTAMTFGLFLFGWIGLGYVIRYKRGLQRALILALFVAGLLYMLTFRNASYVHDYYKVYFMPSFAIAAALFISIVWRRYQRFGRPLMLGLVVSSWILGGVWWAVLHNSGDDALMEAIASDIAAHTAGFGTTIYSEFLRNAGLEYYAYRNFEWEAEPEDFVDTQNRNAYFLLCPTETGAVDYDGALSERDYILIAGGQCRLISLR